MTIDLSSLYPSPASTAPPKPKAGVYIEGWWGSSSHSGATYHSDNAATVSAQADLLQASGVSMVNHTFYGARDTVILASAKLWAAETAKRGMGFSIMVVNDMLKGITTDLTQFLIDQLNQSGLLSAPSYIPEKAVWDFGVLKQVDTVKLAAAFPTITWWREHTNYTWINAPGTRAAQVTYETGHRNTTTLYAPSIWYQFNDQSPKDCTQSVWGGAVRKVDGERGNMFLDLCALPVPASAKYMMFGTLDDYEEGTAIEGMLSALLGIRIA